MVIAKDKKSEIIGKYKINETDTGSSSVQIAVLTERITTLTGHLKTNKKDQHSRRGLLIMVGKRNRLLNYLEHSDKKQYDSLVKRLGL